MKDDSVDASSVPADTRPSHKFAFWAYVHSIIHAEKRNDTWEEIEGPNGRRMFRENVNDYKIISLGFGRSDYGWNQLVEVYSDWGALNNISLKDMVIHPQLILKALVLRKMTTPFSRLA